MNESTLSEEIINVYCDKHKQLFNEMDCVYRCISSSNITEELISKTNEHTNNAMLLWRELKVRFRSLIDTIINFWYHFINIFLQHYLTPCKLSKPLDNFDLSYSF